MNCNHFGLVEDNSHHAYSCIQFGWPELQGLCPDHFREHYVVPAQIAEFEQGQLVAKLQHRVYLVEVAMGLRSGGARHLVVEGSQPSIVQGRESAAQQNCPPTVAGDSVSEIPHSRNGEESAPLQKSALRSRPSLTQRNVEDLEEME